MNIFSSAASACYSSVKWIVKNPILTTAVAFYSACKWAAKNPGSAAVVIAGSIAIGWVAGYLVTPYIVNVVQGISGFGLPSAIEGVVGGGVGTALGIRQVNKGIEFDELKGRNVTLTADNQNFILDNAQLFIDLNEERTARGLDRTALQENARTIKDLNSNQLKIQEYTSKRSKSMQVQTQPQEKTPSEEKVTSPVANNTSPVVKVSEQTVFKITEKRQRQSKASNKDNYTPNSNQMGLV
jgi:hypothetical protein